MNIVKGEGYKPNFTRDDLTDDLHAKAGFRLDTEIVTRQKIKQIVTIQRTRRCSRRLEKGEDCVVGRVAVLLGCLDD